MVSQRCQYAIRALFELAKCDGRGPVKISDVAEAQAIPVRFLELILAQLKQAGFVRSRRGKEGGYFLAVPPSLLTVGAVIRVVEGPLAPVTCLANRAGSTCRLRGTCVFLGMWERAGQAASAVYDGTTFQSLVEEEERRKDAQPTYAI